jgi:hypothetical protein
MQGGMLKAMIAAYAGNRGYAQKHSSQAREGLVHFSLHGYL